MTAERNLAPEEFQSQLTYLGGLNKYDEPNFKLVWAQYETFTAGGAWSVDEQYFRGYRQLLLGSGESCWTLLQWHPAEEYGSPENYYLQNYDPDSGLQTLGEYAYSGRYQVLNNLRWHEMVDNKLVMRALPLTTRTFDSIVPMIIAAKDISIEKRRAAFMAARDREEQDKLSKIEQHLLTNAQPFTGAVSYSRQGIRSTLIDQKMLDLQRMWSQLAKSAGQFSRPGLQTR